MSLTTACALARADIARHQRMRVERRRPDALPSCARDGDFYAINDVCSHADVSLSEGEVDGRTIECWLHGSRFDLRTGQPPAFPRPTPSPSTP